MENFFDMDAFCDFDLNMLFADDENVLSYTLDNAYNTRNDEGTPSSSCFPEFSGVQLGNIVEQSDSRRTESTTKRGVNVFKGKHFENITMFVNISGRKSKISTCRYQNSLSKESLTENLISTIRVLFSWMLQSLDHM